MKIDINSDLGEGAGHDEEILTLVSSANIACGFHAGNPTSIFNSIRSANDKGVAVGAHPSFDDRKNFGRTEMQVAVAEGYALVVYQVGAFRSLCDGAGVEMNHVKPHGALYNMSMRDESLAETIARGVVTVDSKLLFFAPRDSILERAAKKVGLRTVAEVFADRNYNPDGTLVSRTQPNAMLQDPVAAAERVVRMLREKKVRATDGQDVPIVAETICVHGDSPHAVAFVRELRKRLEMENVEIAAPEKS